MTAMNSGLVAVPSPMVGGFHIYTTAGSFDPRLWLAGKLCGVTWFESKAALREVAQADGRELRKHRDYFQLRPRGT